jgi:hypothetical protein
MKSGHESGLVRYYRACMNWLEANGYFWDFSDDDKTLEILGDAYCDDVPPEIACADNIVLFTPIHSA